MQALSIQKQPLACCLERPIRTIPEMTNNQDQCHDKDEDSRTPWLEQDNCGTS